MVSVVQYLNIKPPKWLPDNVMYEVMMGSESYGVSSNDSDIDVYGFCIPPKDMVFPHLSGEIYGFGTQIKRFEQYSEHHIIASNGKEYDVTIYNIVKYFQLAMENNPNMLDSLFVPRRCVLHSTAVSEHLLENRKMFLHKGSYQKFKGYAYAQLSKLDHGENRTNPKRKADMEKFGYSTKFAYHLVRLLLQCEQILIEHDLNVEQNREVLKSIRRGEWTIERIRSWFEDKEKSLGNLYIESTLRQKPDEEAIKSILLQCLEMHYGSLENAIKVDKNYEKLGRDLRSLLDQYKI